MYFLIQDGDTALHTAVRWGETETVDYLLSAGANVNITNNVSQYIVLITYYNVCTYMLLYVTGSAKIDHVNTKTEITFIAQDYSYTQGLSMHSVSIGQCEEVYFSGGHLANPVKSRM